MGVTASTATLSRQSYILERVGVRGRLFAYCLFCCCCPCPRYYGISTFVRCKNWCTLISRSYHTTAHLITHHTTSCPALAHSCFVSVPPSDSGPRQCARRCPSSQAAPAPGTGSQRASGWHKIPIESTLLPHELPHLQPVAVVKVNRRPVLPLLRQLVHRARAPPREAADHEDELHNPRVAQWAALKGAAAGRCHRGPKTHLHPAAHHQSIALRTAANSYFSTGTPHFVFDEQHVTGERRG